MMILGLTGGIATGKSTAAAMLEKLGAYRIDADRLAREVVQPGKPAWRAIVSHFGPGVLYFDRQLNRNALASVIFNDSRERQVLEDITHPLIKELIHKNLQNARKSGAKVALLEVPLLFETGLDSHADRIIVVVADESTQVERMLIRDELTEIEARQRITAQMSLAEKARQADYVIYNAGTPTELEEQVKRLWLELTTDVPVPDTVLDESFHWESENEEVAIVADNGVVSPVAPGSTSIIVTTASGAHAACVVTVKGRPQVSTYKLKCDTPVMAPVSGSKDGDRFTLSIRAQEVRDLGYEEVKLNIAVTNKPQGGKVSLMATDSTGKTYDAVEAGSFGREESFAITKDYSSDIEFTAYFNKPGVYALSFVLVDRREGKTIDVETATINVQIPQEVSAYQVVCDTTGLKFFTGSEASTVLPVKIRPAKVKEFGYNQVRFNVVVKEKPAGAKVRMLAVDSSGNKQDSALLGYYDRANGFPISKDFNKTINFETSFDKAGDYVLDFALVDLKDQLHMIAETSVTVSVQRLPQVSTYEVVSNTSGISFMAASETGTIIHLTVRAKEINDLGYEAAGLSVAVLDMPDGAKAQLFTMDSHGKVYDAASDGSRPPDSFSMSSDYNATVDFNAKFDTPGYYTIRFILTDLAASKELASRTVVVFARAIPKPSVYEIVCDTVGSKFIVSNTKETVLTIIVRTKEVRDFGYENLRLNLAIADRPVGAKAQFFAKSGRGRVYDAAVLSYWGAVTGFPVGKDFYLPIEFNTKFDAVGDYIISFTLVDLNDGSSVVASTDVTITVEPPPEVSVYEIVTDEAGLEFVAGSESGTVIPVTIRGKQVNDLGYENATLYTAVVRRPPRANMQLLAVDGKGQLYDTLAPGYWGPTEGFPLERDHDSIIEFHAKLDTVGNYTITFTLADKKAGSAVIARARLAAKVLLEATTEGAAKLALNRYSLKMTEGNPPVLLVATHVKESGAAPE